MDCNRNGSFGRHDSVSEPTQRFEFTTKMNIEILQRQRRATSLRALGPKPRGRVPIRRLRLPDLVMLPSLAGCQTSDGSFSAVSTATIASKDAFCSIFRDLHSFAPLQIQNLQIFPNFFRENLLTFREISTTISKILTVQKHANLVEFEKCCKMRLCSLS